MIDISGFYYRIDRFIWGIKKENDFKFKIILFFILRLGGWFMFVEWLK